MIVLALVLLPILAGIIMLLIPAREENPVLAKGAGTVIALIEFALALGARDSEFSLRPWLSRPFESSFHFGATGISFWIVLLLAVVTFSAILAMSVPRQRQFVAQMLLLEGTMMGVFLAKDLLLFALFWDLMLLPVFFGLLGWGEHPATAWRYFIYNFAGGLALLLATATFGVLFGSTDVIGRTDVHVVGSWVPWIFIGFAFAFLVKTPVWPLHTWMPPTYSNTPPPMVAVVSAVQSKAGLYGLIVICMAFMPDYLKAYAGVLIVLGVISLLYGAVVSLVQNDTKRIVAYSSLSHLGLIVVAICSFNAIALQGALIYIIAHGLFSAGMFLTLGYVEAREDTRSLVRLGGLGAVNPKLAGALCITSLAALGLPGLAGFVGEIVILTGVFQAGFIWVTILALIPIVIAAAYMLRLFQGVMNGPEVEDLPVRRDLTWLEGIALAPIVLALVVLGVNPHALTTFDPAQYNATQTQVAQGVAR
ncbi:MAG: NADH-quinone oxidoreductase subunit M [Candidatus Eremiobacteraeota bacterium]|nr:NADH-quinone oxidoreductase subunit M [Candidatus Eremiobacteraeota bacterium]